MSRLPRDKRIAKTLRWQFDAETDVRMEFDETAMGRCLGSSCVKYPVQSMRTTDARGVGIAKEVDWRYVAVSDEHASEVVCVQQHVRSSSLIA